MQITLSTEILITDIVRNIIVDTIRYTRILVPAEYRCVYCILCLLIDGNDFRVSKILRRSDTSAVSVGERERDLERPEGRVVECL